MKRAASAIVVLLLLCAAHPLAAPDAISIVRHAERADASADSPLSAADNLFLVVTREGAPTQFFRSRF